MLLLLACAQEPTPPSPPVEAVDTATGWHAVPHAVTLPEVAPATGTAWLPVAPVADDARQLTEGAFVAADLDGDGAIDLFVPDDEGGTLWSQRTARRFTAVPVDVPLPRASAASAVDLDDDGDLDVVVSRFGEPVVLLRNDGGALVDATAASGLPTQRWPGTGGCWGDADGDGVLDLALARYGSLPNPGQPLPAFDDNQLVRHHGDLTFSALPLPSVARRGQSFTCAWLDLDTDGDDDLLFVNDFGAIHPSVLLWRTPEGLVVDEGAAGLGPREDGMGVAVGDLNGDALPDLVYSSLRTLVALESAPGPTWFRTDAARGLVVAPEAPHVQRFGWGAELADLDNDGDDDLAVGMGTWSAYGDEPAQHDGVWVQDTGVFTDRAAERGLDEPGPTRGLLAVDLDGDACLDLVRRVLGVGVRVDWGACPGRGVVIRPRMSPPNRDAVGAVVTVHGDGRTWRRQVVAGSTSLFVGGPPEVHVGVGDLTAVDVEVRWPDGTRSAHLGVPTGRAVVVSHPTRAP